MSKYADLCKAAEKTVTHKEQENIWLTKNEPDRQRFVRELFLEMCNYLGWPTENVKYVDVKSNLVIHGSVLDSLVPLAYQKYDYPAPAGEINSFQTGIEMSLKHGKGNFCILFSFSFLKTGGLGSILFRGNGYDLRDNKRDFFEALNMAFAEVLKKDNRTSPNKDFFGVECEVRTMATEGNDSGGNNQGQQSPLQPVAEVDVGNQCRRCA